MQNESAGLFRFDLSTKYQYKFDFLFIFFNQIIWPSFLQVFHLSSSWGRWLRSEIFFPKFCGRRFGDSKPVNRLCSLLLHLLHVDGQERLHGGHLRHGITSGSRNRKETLADLCSGFSKVSPLNDPYACHSFLV